jgi:putative NIF3 family GTP cyclohydrolase 1 type 2
LAAVPGDVGLGRVGVLSRPEPLSAFVSRVHDALPGTSWGVRAAGDSEATVSRVAVCGGAGDAFLGDAVAAGVDAYLTADLRHHPASEFSAAVAQSPLALLDAAHWATEWPWCELAATQLDEISDRHGWDLRVHVSKTVTDPWTSHSPSLGAPN